MTVNYEKYMNAFVNSFDIDPETAKNLKYQEIDAWDSVGHMGLIAALENAFDIMMDPGDIIDLSSFKKGLEILSQNYEIDFKS